jgi:hypothetical protein
MGGCSVAGFLRGGCCDLTGDSFRFKLGSALNVAGEVRGMPLWRGDVRSRIGDTGGLDSATGSTSIASSPAIKFEETPLPVGLLKGLVVGIFPMLEHQTL